MSTSIYPSLKDIEQNNLNATPEKCQAAAQLTCDLFADSNGEQVLDIDDSTLNQE